MTPSIGVALYPHHAGDSDSLIKAADQAMYEAKQRGRNEVVLFSAEC
ncbi:diguanylate cyclase [Pseudomonas alkylphenolica]|nr:diguanylate cyclase [Pseudomonas alkylphenolica]